MFELIPELLVYLFAVYGMLSLIISAIESFSKRKKPSNNGVRLVILIKNQQDNVEGIVKTILSGETARDIVSNGKLYIVDMGSEDETIKILKKLKNNYDMIEIFNKDEKELIFEEIKAN